MFSFLILLVFCSTALFAADAARTTPIDLIEQGRFREASVILDTTHASERYHQLLLAATEPDGARACSLYQMITERFSGTDCDSFARRRLDQAHEAGYQPPPATQLLFTTAPEKDAPDVEIADTGNSTVMTEMEPGPVEVQAEILEPETVEEPAAETVVQLERHPTDARETIEEPVPADPEFVDEEIVVEQVRTAPELVTPPPVEKPAATTEEPKIEVTSPEQKPNVVPVPDPGVPHEIKSAPNGKWYVQVGAFGNRDNADRLAATLRAAGYQVKFIPRETSTATLLQVRVGGYGSEQDARRIAEELKARFDTPSVVISE